MALVSQGFSLTVTLRDTGNDRAVLVYDLDSADYATAVTDAATILGRLAAVTDAAIQSYRVAEKFVENAFAFPANAEVEKKALVIGRINGAVDKYVNILIPAPKPGLFVSSQGDAYNTVDIGDTDLNMYISTWQATNGIASLSDGERLADTNPLLSGHRVTQKSNRG